MVINKKQLSEYIDRLKERERALESQIDTMTNQLCEIVNIRNALIYYINEA